MTLTYEHINTTGRLQLVEEQPDWFPHLTELWKRAGGTTMPSSPMCDEYMLTSKYQNARDEAPTVYNPVLRYRANIRWAKHSSTLLKLVDPQQVWHRSRAIAIAVDSLRIAEMQRRISRANEKLTEYREHGASDRLSYEISQIVIEETRRHMHLNWDNISAYIRDHIRSSLGGGGFKWRSAFEINRSEWKSILEQQLENLELMEAHRDWYPSNEPRTGERARSGDLKPGEPPIWFPSEDSWYDVERTRIITFGNYMSLYTPFIVDKASWYGTVLKKVFDAVKPAAEYFTPLIEGGKIYLKYAELHEKTNNFQSYDATTWDAGAGIVLGKYMHSFMFPAGGIPQVATGQSHTTMDGTIAAIIASSKVGGTFCVFGDDLPHWGPQRFHGTILEADPDDTKYKFNSGVTYWHDPRKPRITGWKPTNDRSRDMIPLHMEPNREFQVVIGGTHTVQQRAAHAGMYLGDWADGTLLDAISKITASNFKSPRELFEDMVATTPESAFRWAEELNIKEAFA